MEGLSWCYEYFLGSSLAFKTSLPLTNCCCEMVKNDFYHVIFVLLKTMTMVNCLSIFSLKTAKGHLVALRGNYRPAPISYIHEIHFENKKKLAPI